MSITDAPATPDGRRPGRRGARAARARAGPRLPPGRRRRPAGPAWSGCTAARSRMGDLDMPEADWTARQICERAGAVVVSVDYRLCDGGVTYPVPHDDVVAAVRWVRDSAAALGIDPDRISVGGASAGGNLAAGADAAAPGRRRLAARRPAAGLHDAARRRPAAVGVPRARCWPTVPALLRFLPEDRRVHHRELPRRPGEPADGYAMPGQRRPRGALPGAAAQRRVRRPARRPARCSPRSSRVAGVDVRQVLVAGHAARLPEHAPRPSSRSTGRWTSWPRRSPPSRAPATELQEISA